MNSTTRAMASSYLEWAKLYSDATYNLATSGIASYPLASLPVSLADLDINGPTIYGYDPLKEKLAQTSGVHPDQVFTTNGTSMANHMAMAATLAPGDDVLIECPTYGLLLEVASYLGANILRFSRRTENDFQIDIEEVRAKITPKTKLIVLTNLHNPTGAFTGEALLRQLGEIAAQAGAHVLVDEVYLPMSRNLSPEATTGESATPATRSAIRLGQEFIVTSSLTKSYGLSGLRCGWILAEPALTERIWKLNDLFNASPVYISEQLSLIALDNLPKIAARSRELLQDNRPALDAFFSRIDARGNDDLEVFRPSGGTVCFPRLNHGSVADFCRRLRSEFETSVVPGEYFEMPQHFRIGIGGDPDITAKGLANLAMAFDSFQST
jgi:aspartate/methionine/tyrosine aminotransferase